MPVASFLEEYDFSGKIILPFCSHGGGRFGQSLTAIAKLAPDALIGEGLAISYSRGSGMPDDVLAWLEENKAALYESGLEVIVGQTEDFTGMLELLETDS